MMRGKGSTSSSMDRLHSPVREKVRSVLDDEITEDELLIAGLAKLSTEQVSAPRGGSLLHLCFHLNHEYFSLPPCSPAGSANS